jgi:hypothetical protein
MKKTKMTHDTMYLVHKKKYKIVSPIISIAICFSLDDTLFLKVSENLAAISLKLKLSYFNWEIHTESTNLI